MHSVGQKNQMETTMNYLETFKRARALLVSLAFGLVAAAAAAGPWPERPIKIVVSSAAGGGPDILARQIAQKLSSAVGQPVIVENKIGANGIIAVSEVARSAPDGYTLLYTGASSTALNQALRTDLPFDVQRDLQPVTQIGVGANYLVVAADMPIADMDQFVRYAKARPQELAYASWGVGSPGHLTMAAIENQAGIQLRHIPYKSIPQMLQDLQAGTVKVAVVDPVSSLPFIRSGSIKVVSAIGTVKGPLLPEVRTMNEQGYRFDANGWHGVFVAARTPEAIVVRLNHEINAILKDADMRARLTQLNIGSSTPTSPSDFQKILQSDIQFWSQVVTTNHIAAN
ncbi:MAG: ABC transporter substrate-binding protein [Variovorax paradoxus]|uniref:ABC transporter substrate-binding protein n=1 Tax=Variovorax paradoxus TaxID=34073 RepID=A0A2W5SUM7_VARPD|nr:MAG: ABC transporter substrate-binding protein [Variovorax paradoxus]